MGMNFKLRFAVRVQNLGMNVLKRKTSSALDFIRCQLHRLAYCRNQLEGYLFILTAKIHETSQVMSKIAHVRLVIHD
jgi:hypothetical protein